MSGATQDPSGATHVGHDGRAPSGLVCALPEELGSLTTFESTRRGVQGLELIELALPGGALVACVGGVGKVAAARAATVLVGEGVRRLLVVGVCGSLRRELGPGAMLHALRAFQADLGVRAGRESESDPELRAAWRAVQPAEEGWFLTADRPVLTRWRRRQLGRAFAGPAVADMETAAAAAVARAAGLPWAALRAVTDQAGPKTRSAFGAHYPVQAGRAADTVPALLERLAGRGRP